MLAVGNFLYPCHFGHGSSLCEPSSARMKTPTSAVIDDLVLECDVLDRSKRNMRAKVAIQLVMFVPIFNTISTITKMGW